MPIIKGLEWTFDTVSSTYAKMRPGYVEELYRKMFDYIWLDETSNVIEVGIGGGQATEPILQTGCKLTAVEYGENFSQLCREKFKEYPNFSIVTDKFENVDFQDNFYDFVYSASAFHWVPEEIGYSKIFSLLKTGGVFARFSNHPFRDKGNLLLSDKIDQIYEQYYYKFYTEKHEEPKAFDEEMAKTRANIASKYGFTDICYHLFYRTRTFSAEEYITLLGTYSDHIAIDEEIRMEFFSKIKEAINENGGTFTLYDTIDLELARKR